MSFFFTCIRPIEWLGHPRKSNARIFPLINVRLGAESGRPAPGPPNLLPNQLINISSTSTFLYATNSMSSRRLPHSSLRSGSAGRRSLRTPELKTSVIYFERDSQQKGVENQDTHLRRYPERLSRVVRRSLLGMAITFTQALSRQTISAHGDRIKVFS